MRGTPTLRRRLMLEARETVPDGSGGFASVWRELGTLWADVSVRTAQELFVSAQERPIVRYQILVRAAPVGAPSRPLPEQRFREGTRVFDILTVTEADPAGRYLAIMAEEGRS